MALVDPGIGILRETSAPETSCSVKLSNYAGFFAAAFKATLEKQTFPQPCMRRLRCTWPWRRMEARYRSHEHDSVGVCTHCSGLHSRCWQRTVCRLAQASGALQHKLALLPCSQVKDICGAVTCKLRILVQPAQLLQPLL